MVSTIERVPANTADQVNDRIRCITEAQVYHYARHPDQLERRLAELEREWDVERAIEIEGATMVLLGSLAGTLLGRKSFVVPAMAGSMLLLHGVQGWYPLLPLFRRLGFRTEREIAEERYALKAIRGDFSQVRETTDAGRRADAAFEAALTSPA